jgi:hypothetical protein
MQQLGQLISSQIGPGCLKSPVASRADGTPDCEVEDVTANPDGTTSIAEINVVCREQQHAALLAAQRSVEPVPPRASLARPSRALCKKRLIPSRS